MPIAAIQRQINVTIMPAQFGVQAARMTYASQSPMICNTKPT